MALPPAPAHEDQADACCPACGSLFHSAEGHRGTMLSATFGLTGAAVPDPGFPAGYDPAEADRMIGRDVPDPQ